MSATNSTDLQFAPDAPRIVATMQAVRDRLWVKNEVRTHLKAGKKLAAESVKRIRAEETHIRYEEVNMLKKRFKSRQVWKAELPEDKDV